MGIEIKLKKCNKCKEDFEPTLENFAANKKNPDGLQYHCRSCQEEYKRQWRKRYKEEHGESDGSRYSRAHREDQAKHRAEYVERNRRIVLNIKGATPCKDCGKFFPPVCMDFDHIRDTKKSSVSKLMHTGASVEKLMEEIRKCELVCANCHRIRTDQREKPWTEDLRVYDRSDWFPIEEQPATFAWVMDAWWSDDNASGY